MTLARRVLRDPAWCFLVVGGVVAALLFVIMPPFTGIDEISHFARTYQISEGDLVPQQSIYHDRIRKGSGACLPSGVVSALELHAAELYVANLPYVGGGGTAHDHGASTPTTPPAPTTTMGPTTTTVPAGPPPSARATPARQCEGGRRYVDLSTFAWYSPVPYALGATAFAVLRPFDPSIDLLSYVGRFAELALYLAIVFVAIRRAPRARWPLCIAALVPVAMFQANSLSPDAFTTAMAILVLSSALRVLDRPSARVPRSMLVEAVGLSVLLGLSKPTYVVVALAYLIPLLDRARRRESWILLAPVAVGIAVSTIWQRATEHLFVCDQRFFGVRADPGQQTTTILTQPWRFAGATVTGLADYGTQWIRDSTSIGGRILDWPTAVAVVVLAGFVVLACQQDRAPVRPLAVRERLGFLAVAVFGFLAVIAGWLLYCSAPGMRLHSGLHARLFAPLIPLFFVALAPDGRLATRFGNLRVPPAIALVPFFAVWLTGIAQSLH